ncbi:MAG: hypothetical protein GY869_10420 [Planctomycetes bacterium]|nr:hypothetical protein [Planctomycetota bacterium]
MMGRSTIWIFLVVVLCAWLGFCSGALGQVTWYVDNDGVGDPEPNDTSLSDPLEDGSVDHPFDAIQEGIDAAMDEDVIRVLDGIYMGAGNRDIDF